MKYTAIEDQYGCLVIGKGYHRNHKALEDAILDIAGYGPDQKDYNIDSFPGNGCTIYHITVCPV